MNKAGPYGQDSPVDTDEGLYSALMGVASGLELKATLRRIVTNAVYLADASYGALGVLDFDGKIQDFIHVGMPDEVSERIGNLPMGGGLLGELSAHPTPLRLAHINEHPASIGFPENHPPMTSFLGVPIRIRGEVFGNLYLTSKKGGEEFTEEDEHSVIAFATAAAVAIENARLYELATLKEKWQRAVSEIGTAVLSGGDSGEVLELIAGRSRLLTGAAAALIALPDSTNSLTIEIVNIDRDSTNTVRRLRSWLGLPAPTDSILKRSFSLGGSIIESECSIWNEVMTDSGEERVAAVALPLRTVDKVLGVLLLIWPKGSLIAASSVIDLVESFAGQAALTLVLAEAQQDKEDFAVLQDRDRIGRDLHDLVIQRVFATGMLLNGLLQDQGLPPNVGEKIDLAVGQLDETIREIRQTIFDLHTESSDTSIKARISQEVNSASNALGFPIRLTLMGPLDSTISPLIGEHLLAVVRESLTNCAKHSHATEVDIRVEIDSPVLVCEVIDNGNGYSAGARFSGIANMESRAVELGGELVVGARPDAQQGTRLRWSVPLA
jgi:signal transduction histidine kinase